MKSKLTVYPELVKKSESQNCFGKKKKKILTSVLLRYFVIYLYQNYVTSTVRDFLERSRIWFLILVYTISSNLNRKFKHCKIKYLLSGLNIPNLVLN